MIGLDFTSINMEMTSPRVSRRFLFNIFMHCAVIFYELLVMYSIKGTITGLIYLFFYKKKRVSSCQGDL